MLTRLLAMDLRLCLSVSVSVTSRCSIEMDRRMELFYGIQASFDESYTALKANSGIYRIKDTSFWNFVRNSGLDNFALTYRSSKRVIDLAR